MKTRWMLCLAILLAASAFAVWALATPLMEAEARPAGGAEAGITDPGYNNESAAGGNYRLFSQTGPVPAGPTASEPGTLAGGNYRLQGSSPARKESGPGAGLASGGDYRLQSAPSGSENGCCCVYLPCLRK